MLISDYHKTVAVKLFDSLECGPPGGPMLRRVLAIFKKLLHTPNIPEEDLQLAKGLLWTVFCDNKPLIDAHLKDHVHVAEELLYGVVGRVCGGDGDICGLLLLLLRTSRELTLASIVKMDKPKLLTDLFSTIAGNVQLVVAQSQGGWFRWLIGTSTTCKLSTSGHAALLSFLAIALPNNQHKMVTKAINSIDDSHFSSILHLLDTDQSRFEVSLLLYVLLVGGGEGSGGWRVYVEERPRAMSGFVAWLTRQILVLAGMKRSPQLHVLLATILMMTNSATFRGHPDIGGIVGVVGEMADSDCDEYTKEHAMAISLNLRHAHKQAHYRYQQDPTSFPQFFASITAHLLASSSD